MRRSGRGISALAWACLGLMYLPMAAVAAYSVNASRFGARWGGFTLDWYRRLLNNEQVRDAAWNTLALAAVSTLIATVLGTLLALGMRKAPWPRAVRRLMDLLIYLPVVTPDIIFAVAVVVMFGLLRTVWMIFEPGLTAMIVAHVTFQVAFVTLVVSSRLAIIGSVVEEAARDLYASGWYVLRRVMLPLLAPGIAAGAMLAFILSLDDFVISFFTHGPDSVTLPIYIYASVRRGVSPEIHALSTLIFLFTILLVLGLQVLGRRRKGAAT
ncbi:MAG: Inner membrane ABC transporter permease protein YdcV [Phycisphaerae bacterium]|nr:Inner membrane ABC transporter permease protein YdcV [Phycisphaerae bacterium]